MTPVAAQIENEPNDRDYEGNVVTVFISVISVNIATLGSILDSQLN